ncbi:replication protein C, IncQ-type [Pseudomonadota bacterium]|nr:replication protein C, IncQ-type [Pseudomonadota bacterium]
MSDNIKFPIARSHPALHACPQFRPIRRGARRKALERTYRYKNGDWLKVYLFHELDIADQSLLLAILSIARVKSRGMVISVTSIAPLIGELKLKGYDNKDTIMIRTNGFELLKELSKSTGRSDYKWLRASLKRLSLVNFERSCNNPDGSMSFSSFNLLSLAGEQNKDGVVIGEIEIALNPMSASAIIGNNEGYVLTHRHERNLLTTDEAKSLHSSLCGLVSRNKKRHLSVDKLADRVYARYEDIISPVATRKRRASLVKAATEINNLEGWVCDVIGKGISTTFIISR